MSKITKLIFTFITLLTICTQFAYATDSVDYTDETLDVTPYSDSESLDTDTTESNNTSTDSFTFNTSGVTSVSQLSNYSEANLELNNILNIILIAIGVLIILFAIAILIRLKK